MITARKGLPVSLGGDGAKLRTLTTDGYPGACPFYPEKTQPCGDYDGSRDPRIRW
jgi:hypothetical protein